MTAERLVRHYPSASAPRQTLSSRIDCKRVLVAWGSKCRAFVLVALLRSLGFTRELHCS
jgi:hypothetical protein